MAHQSFLFLLTSLLLSLPLTLANEPSVTLFKLESQSSINGLKVTIQCITSGSISGNRTFFRARELNSSDVERVRSLEGSGNEILLTFELTPMLEGYYFCQVGNLTSNKLPLVGTLGPYYYHYVQYYAECVCDVVSLCAPWYVVYRTIDIRNYLLLVQAMKTKNMNYSFVHTNVYSKGYQP